MKPKANIIVSLATNRCDDRKLNRKVNTVISLIQEYAEDNSEDSQFVLCDNNSLSTNSEIRSKCIHTDGYHLSEEGLKVPASNLRKSIDKVLDLYPRSNKKPWHKPKGT